MLRLRPGPFRPLRPPRPRLARWPLACAGLVGRPWAFATLATSASSAVDGFGTRVPSANLSLACSSPARRERVLWVFMVDGVAPDLWAWCRGRVGGLSIILSLVKAPFGCYATTTACDGCCVWEGGSSPTAIFARSIADNFIQSLCGERLLADRRRLAVCFVLDNSLPFLVVF